MNRICFNRWKLHKIVDFRKKSLAGILENQIKKHGSESSDKDFSDLTNIIKSFLGEPDVCGCMLKCINMGPTSQISNQKKRFVFLSSATFSWCMRKCGNKNDNTHAWVQKHKKNTHIKKSWNYDFAIPRFF